MYYTPYFVKSKLVKELFKKLLEIYDCKSLLKTKGDHSIGVHVFPFRTEPLSPIAPMVLRYSWESRSSPVIIWTNTFVFVNGQ